MARKPFLFDAVFEDDLSRVKMGRFNEADEHMLEGIIRGKGAQLWRLFGQGRHHIDIRRPGIMSSRPSTPEGGQTFAFIHKTVSKKYRQDLKLRDRWFLTGMTKSRGPELRAAGAHYSAHVSIAGTRGGWWVPAGTPAPEGTSFAQVGHIFSTAKGEQRGAAAGRQRYIERSDAVEAVVDTIGEVIQTSSVGNIACDLEGREGFWRAVERRERADGRVQGTIIAELPYEREIGPEGRLKILETFGQVFEDLGLRWHGAVHRPDAHSDRRNYHIHLVYCERPAEWLEGRWQFASKKATEPRDRSFIGGLRKRYAEIVNREFERTSVRRRFDPRTYREMGIDKEPCEHLGVAAAALERKGIVTVGGRRNVVRERVFRLLKHAESARDGLAEDIRQLDGSMALIAQAREALSPRVARAADHLADTIVGYGDAVEVHRRCEVHAAVINDRATDILRRPQSAATFSDDPETRREARTIAEAVETWGRRERQQATIALRAARRTRAKSEKDRKMAERALYAEILLADRARVMAGLDHLCSKLDDGRLSEAEWRREGETLRERRRIAEHRIDRAETAIQSALKPSGPHIAKKVFGSLVSGGNRKETLERLRQALPMTVERIEANLTERRAGTQELYAVTGEERKRRRVDGDPDYFRRRVRTAAEGQELIRKLRMLSEEVAEIDKRILANPDAYDLAVKQSWRDRIGREHEHLAGWLRGWRSRSPVGGTGSKLIVSAAVRLSLPKESDKTIHSMETRPERTSERKAALKNTDGGRKGNGPATSDPASRSKRMYGRGPGRSR